MRHIALGLLENSNLDPLLTVMFIYALLTDNLDLVSEENTGINNYKVLFTISLPGNGNQESEICRSVINNNYLRSESAILILHIFDNDFFLDMKKFKRKSKLLDSTTFIIAPEPRRDSAKAKTTAATSKPVLQVLSFCKALRFNCR